MAKGSKPQGEEAIKKPLIINTLGLQGVSGDKTESGSLTPTITRKTTPFDSEITIKEYGDLGQTNYVKRFAIIPDTTKKVLVEPPAKEKFHAIESSTFKDALQ